MNGTTPRRARARKGNAAVSYKNFYIEVNKVAVCDLQSSASTVLGNTEKFGTERELAKIAATWPSSRLREIWNTLPGTRLVRKFTDRKTAARVWNEAKKLHPSPSPPKRTGTKAEQILALLRQPSGATLNSIIKATGWQAHSVRGQL